MKKILSLILAGLMTLSAASFVAADDAAVDAAVEQTNTAEDYAIEFLANYGIFKGTSAAELVADADAAIQRYQMALFVSRISTGWVDDAQWEDGPANNSTFEDIGDEPANKYLGALSYANQNGIIEGYSATKFAPYDGITYRDALTMVVRTLGYKNLAYPWGYIQQAVELGLTEDVDAAYTDELTRGQVAVIIYNAMFANTKAGETLAKKIFGCDFGWEEIVIVASNEASFAASGLRAKDGYVAFKILDKNGKLGANTYYVKKSELGLNGDHDDELQVGAAYIALFTIKDDIASMVSADSLNYKTVYNLGITDNAGEAVATMPIKAALADLKIVKEYQKSDIISAADSEIIIYSVGTTTIYDEVGSRVAIDWNTQNILVWKDASKDEKGNVIPEHWDIAWYYNKTLDRYYELVYDKANHTVGINWMSDEEFVKFYKEAVKQFKAELQEYKNIGADGVKAEAPYAKLRLFDTTAAMGLFKDYAIGKISLSTKKCTIKANNVDHSAGKDMPSYKITDLAGNEKFNLFVEKDHTAHETATEGFAWLNVADFVTTFYKEDGSFENGSIVVYNVNKTTGEIEIIKHVTTKGSASDDADSYIATGVLKAYNVNTPEVNIDGQKLPLGYANLNGVTFGNVTEKMATKYAAATILDKCQMQYVTYVVVDGRVVDIALRGQTSDIIVVLGYAGITSDDYIAVYGYGSDKSDAHIYRINSYNGWKKGDYRYYPANAWTDKAFTAGTIYNVTSWDEATDSYNVYTENSDMSATDGLATYKFEFDRGYRTITKYKADGTTVADNYPVIEKMSKDDKYFIVDTANAGVVYVRTGILDESFYAYGKAVVKTTDNVYVIYVDTSVVGNDGKAINIKGFQNTAHEIGFVVYDKATGAALSQAYDDAIGSEWYLLGSTQAEVVTFDLLTGNKETCFVSNNIDLVKGHVYVTMNFGDTRMIINELPDNVGCLHGKQHMGTCEVLDRIGRLYNEENVAYARFMVEENLTFTKDGVAKITLADAFGFIKADAAGKYNKVDEKIAADAIGDIAYYVFGDNGNHTVEEIKAAELNDYTFYTGTAIYDCVTKKVVVYILAGEETKKTAEVGQFGDKALTVASWNYTLLDGSQKEASLKLAWNGTYSASAKKTTLDKATLYFDYALDEDHGDIAKNGYLFGIDADQHGKSYFAYNNTRVNYNGKEYAVCGDGLLSFDTIECNGCDLVKSVTVDLSKASIAYGAQNEFEFIIKGDNVTADGLHTGNDIRVTFKFDVDKFEYAVKAEILNGGAKINGDLNGNLNSIDLQDLANAGIEG